jgi:hypothetical protein
MLSPEELLAMRERGDVGKARVGYPYDAAFVRPDYYNRRNAQIEQSRVGQQPVSSKENPTLAAMQKQTEEGLAQTGQASAIRDQAFAEQEKFAKQPGWANAIVSHGGTILRNAGSLDYTGPIEQLDERHPYRGFRGVELPKQPEVQVGQEQQTAKPEQPFTPKLDLFKADVDTNAPLAATNPEVYQSQVKVFTGQLLQSPTPQSPQEFEDTLKSLSSSQVPGNLGALREAGEKYLATANPKLYRQLIVSNFEGTANDVSKVSFFDAAYPDMSKGMSNAAKLEYISNNPALENRWRNDFFYPKYRFDVKTGNVEETMLPTVETVKNRRTLQEAGSPAEFFEKGGKLTAESLRPFNLPEQVVGGLLNANQVRQYKNVTDLAAAAGVPGSEIGALQIDNKIRESSTARVSELAASGIPPVDALKQVILEAQEEGAVDTTNTQQYAEYGTAVAMAVRDVYTAIGDQSIREAQVAIQGATARGSSEIEKRTPLVMAQASTPEFIQSVLDSKVSELQANLSRAEVGAKMGGPVGQRAKANLLQLRQELGIPTELPRNLSVESILSDYILPSMSVEYANDTEMKAFLDEQIVNLKVNPSGVNPAIWNMGQMVAGEWSKGAKAFSQQIEERKQNVVARIALENPAQPKMTTSDLVAMKTWNPETNKEDTQYFGVDRAMQSVASPNQIAQMMVGLDNKGKKQFMASYGFQPGTANVITADTEIRLYSESIVRARTRLQSMEQTYNPSNMTSYVDLMTDSKGQKLATIPPENWIAAYQLMSDPNADMDSTQRGQLQVMLQESFNEFANSPAANRVPLPTLYADINKPTDFNDPTFKTVNPSINVNATFMAPEVIDGAVSAIKSAVGDEKYAKQLDNISLAVKRNAGQFKPGTLDILRTGATRDKTTSDSVGPIHDFIYETEGGDKPTGKERIATLDEILDGDIGTNEKLDIARSLRDLAKKADDKKLLFKAYAIAMDDAREGQEYVGKTVVDQALRGASVATAEVVGSIASEMTADFATSKDMVAYFENRNNRLNFNNAEAVAFYAADLDFALDAIGKELKRFNVNMTDVKDKSSKLGSDVIEALMKNDDYADKLKELDGLQESYIALAKRRNALPYLTPMGVARTPAGALFDFATTPVRRAYQLHHEFTEAAGKRIKSTAVGMAKGMLEQIKGE